MTKKTYIIIAVIALIAIAGFVYWNGMQKEQPEMPVAQEQQDTTDAIVKDLADINVGDVNAEFKDVDTTINGL